MRSSLTSSPARVWSAGFAVATLFVVTAFTASIATRPIPPVWNNDSFGYVEPAVMLAAGQDLTSHLDRGIGYPGFLAAMLHLASLRALPRFQLASILVGMVLLSAILYLFLRSAIGKAFPDGTRPAGVLARVVAVLLGATYPLLVLLHDGFELKLYTVWAEATHFLLAAVALAFLVAGQVARTPRVRVLALTLATGAAYLSTTFKPHTLFVFAFILAALAVALALHWRLLKSPAVILSLACLALLIGSITLFERQVASNSGREFGAKTLFCNHLPLVIPVIGQATPEEAQLSATFRGILAEGSEGWPLLGHNGDRCMYNGDVDPIETEIARSHGLTRAQWYRTEFLRAIARRPLVYARRVLRQVIAYFEEPVLEVTSSESGGMQDWDWVRLDKYRGFLGQPREAFTIKEENWFAGDAGRIGAAGKSALVAANDWFPFTTIPTTLLAAGVLLAVRRRKECRAEIALLSVAAFVMAYVLLIACSHSFDISRYRSALVPFTMLWLVLSVAYLAAMIGLAGRHLANRLRSGHSASEIGPSRHLCSSNGQPALGQAGQLQ